MRLIVAQCEVRYTGRAEAFLPEALRLLMIKEDGSVMVHADTGGYKPQNWMTPPTVIEEEGDPVTKIVIRKKAGKTEDRLEITISEVLSDSLHDMVRLPHWRRTGLRRTCRPRWPRHHTGVGRASGLCAASGRRTLVPWT
ncbi:MAG: endonuclease NucS [Solirubrobacterales bacterium]|nr:endonuclease NucS [Solirubrobacterales bacterium]